MKHALSGMDYRLPKTRVRHAFERAAPRYNSAAHIQRAAAQRLLALTLAQSGPACVRRVLDAGCGTGQNLPLLSAHYPQAQYIALDFSAAMLAHITSPALPACADIEHLPLKDESVDLYWSSLALQWCTPEVAIRESARVLSPGGVARIATLGPLTLHELRTAFRSVDDDTHVIDFFPVERWLETAQACGLSIQHHENGMLFDSAPELRTLLGNIKTIGARTVGRQKQTLGRKGWQTLQSTYETFRRADGLLPATYDLILLALRKPGCHG